MSPSANNDTGSSNVKKVLNVGNIGGQLLTNQLDLAPVINIKPEYAIKMSGTGYMDDPYIIG